ncbi:cyclic nucleotide-binding domain-containing protein [Anditalea andensis]|nr:hypothetical protein [Anditalea andensis]
MDIFRYAVDNDLFFGKVFTQLFLKARKLVFQKGEEVKFNHKDTAFLVFLHEGAVLGTLYYKGKVLYKAIKTRQYIFVHGPWKKSPYDIDQARWIVTNKAEITAIPMEVLFKDLAAQPGSSLTLEKHIEDMTRMDFQDYHQISGFTSIDDKIDFLIATYPGWIRNTHKYLADYLSVSQNGLSNALKKWDINHFGML